MTTHHPRVHPVILLTGTPGTGKTTHAALLASTSSSPMVHINVSDLVKEKGFHEGWDEEYQSWIVDEDKLLDHLETVVNPPDASATTGFIIDHHSPSLYPERWIDLAVVLMTDNEVLWQRLEERNYPSNKIQSNVTTEILQSILQETYDSYAKEIVVPLQSDGKKEGEVEENVERICSWVEAWKRDGGKRRESGDGEGEESDSEGEGEEGEAMEN